MWRLISILLAAGAARGWQYEYATNRDGSVLYFSSSLRMKGAAQHFYPKIFVWEAGKGVRLYEQRPSDVPAEASALAGWAGSQYFSLVGVDVSSDSSTLAVIGVRSCTAAGCGEIETYETSVYASGRSAITLPGAAILSRNGRYALLSSSISNNANPLYPVSVPVVDLRTGQRTSYSAWRLGFLPTRRVADDGTLLLSTSTGWVLARDGQTTVLGIPGENGWINAAATLVVYSSGPQLFSYSIATRTSTLLAAQAPYLAALSDDGSVIAFGGDAPSPDHVRQVYVVHSDGTGLRQLTHFPEGAWPAAVSGDGKVAFAITGDQIGGNNRIVRVDVASGQWTQIVPAMPGPLSSSGNGTLPAWPGALTTLYVTGLVKETIESQPPLPYSLGGVEARIGGQPAPLASVSPWGVRFQVPWDLPEGYSDLELHGPYFDTSLFVAGTTVAPAPPRFAVRGDDAGTRRDRGILAAAHEDFGAPVSYANPAQPGEVIHLYASGLGPVSPLPAPGEATPMQPLSALTAPLACQLRMTYFITAGPMVALAPAEVLFAGLAPRMMGVHQVDLRMPAWFPIGVGVLECRIGHPAWGVLLSGYLPLLNSAN